MANTRSTKTETKKPPTSARNSLSNAMTSKIDASQRTSIGPADKKSEFQSKLEKLAKIVHDLQQSNDFLAGKFEESESVVKQLQNTQKQMQQTIAALTTKCNKMSIEMEQLRSKTNTVEQAKVSTNVLIRGVKTDDDPKEAIRKIAEIAAFEVNVSVIASAKHITNEKSQSVIVAKFNDESKKRNFIKAAKKAKVSAQTYGYTDKTGPIYVDEQLTKQTFLLFKRTKELKKQGYKFVWISNGEILARKNEKSTAIRITTESQVIDLENEILMSNEEKKAATKQKKHNKNSKQQEQQHHQHQQQQQL